MHDLRSSRLALVDENSTRTAAELSFVAGTLHGAALRDVLHGRVIAKEVATIALPSVLDRAILEISSSAKSMTLFDSRLVKGESSRDGSRSSVGNAGLVVVRG